MTRPLEPEVPRPPRQPKVYWAIALTMMGVGIPLAALACMTLGLGASPSTALEQLAIMASPITRVNTAGAATIGSYLGMVPLGAALAFLPGLITARVLQKRLNRASLLTNHLPFSLLHQAFVLGLGAFWILQFIPPFTLFAIFILMGNHPILLGLALTLISGGSASAGLAAGHAVMHSASKFYTGD